MELELGGRAVIFCPPCNSLLTASGDGKSLALGVSLQPGFLIVPFSEVGSLHFMIHLLSAPCACLLGRMMAEFLGSYIQYQGPQNILE